MKRTFGKVVSRAAIAFGFLLSCGTANAAVTVSYYSDYTDTGSGITVTGTPFDTATFDFPAGIALGDLQSDASVNTAAHWPGAARSFAAILTGTSDIAGTFNAALTSDDGSYFFVNGTRVLSNGGDHGIQTVTGPVTLALGDALEVQYFNSFCCGAGVSLGSVASSLPEPSTWGLAIIGAAVTGWALRRRRAEVASLV